MNKKGKKQSKPAKLSHKIPSITLIPPETQFLHLAQTSLQKMFLLNKFKQILKLDISNTFVYNLEKCEPHFSISSINLQNTPLSKIPYYRIMLLISFCPNATIIDDVEVTDEERMNASSLKLMVKDYISKGFSLISLSPVQIANQTEAFELTINYLDLNKPIKKKINISNEASPTKPNVKYFLSPKLQKMKNTPVPNEKLLASQRYKQWRKDNNLDQSEENESNENTISEKFESTVSQEDFEKERASSQNDNTESNIENSIGPSDNPYSYQEEDIIEQINENSTASLEQSAKSQTDIDNLDQPIDNQEEIFEQPIQNQEETIEKPTENLESIENQDEIDEQTTENKDENTENPIENKPETDFAVKIGRAHV